MTTYTIYVDDWKMKDDKQKAFFNLIPDVLQSISLEIEDIYIWPLIPKHDTIKGIKSSIT